MIEDEAGIAGFVQKALQANGHQVDVCADGLEGEHRALTEDLDLVILDRLLPGREGVEVLRGIRATKPELPVIMLTALAEVHHKVAALDAGATDYVTKPFSVDELLARVRAHLRRPDQSASTRLSLRWDHRRSALPRGRRATARRCASRPRSSSCWSTSCAIPTRCSRASSSSAASGATDSTRTPTSSRSTSGTCAASSPSRTGRCRSTPSARSGYRLSVR